MPLPISPRSEIGDLTEPPKSKNGIHPHNPALLVLHLEQTLAGCDWLLQRWGDLVHRIEVERFWTATDAFKMVRLMGKLAIAMAEDCSVAQVFLCSVTLSRPAKNELRPEPIDWSAALIRLLCDFDAEVPTGVAKMVITQCEPFSRRLDEMPLATLAMADRDEARRWLRGLIERHRIRLRRIRAVLQQIADADAAEAPARLAFETGPEGERHRRYCAANERKVDKRIDMFLRIRTAVIAGKFDPSDFDFGDPEMEAICRASQQVAAAESDRAAAERTSRGDENGEEWVGDTMTESVVDGESPVANDWGDNGCDDDRFLRNEAKDELVRGPLSVVLGGVEAVGEVCGTTGGAGPATDGMRGPHPARWTTFPPRVGMGTS